MVSTEKWSTFRESFRRNWKQGEHVTVIGPTGSGKSVLVLEIMKLRRYYVLLLTKGNDSTADRFIAQNELEFISEWPPSGFDDKIALWPKFKGVDSFATQSRVMRDAINGFRRKGRKIAGIYEEGGRAVLIDEVMYFSEELDLDKEMRMLWTQGRSNNISLVAGTQRPRTVPMVMLNQWTHLFCFQTADKYEIDRLASVGGNQSSIIKEHVPQLEPHYFLYVHRLRKDAIISKVERG